MTLLRTVLALVLIAVSSGPALAQSLPAPAPEEVTAQPKPLFPSRELNRWREGWVLVDYLVSEDGTVGEARVLDSSGSKYFDKASLRAIQKWEFDPLPRETKRTTLVNFEFQRTELRLSHRFYSRYMKIQESIDNGELNDAQRLVDRIRADSKSSVYELAYTDIAEGRLAGQRGDRSEQLRLFRRAMLGDGRWVAEDTYCYLLYATVVLAIREEEFASAIRDYALLNETKAGREIAADLDEPIRSIQTMVDGEDGISPPFMVADLQVSVRKERPGLTEDVYRDGRGWGTGVNSIAEREYRRMQENQRQP